MKTMNIKYVSGISGDRIEVSIYNEEEKLFEETYSYGYNASYNRQFAKMAESYHEKAIKYKWTGRYPLKPFIGDILTDLCNKYEINKDEINYSGYYVFSGKEMPEDETKKLAKNLFEGKE